MSGTIFLSGATGSIGRTLARHLDGRGYRLVLSDRDSYELQRLAAELQKEAVLAPLDLWAAGYDQYYALGAEIRASLGSLAALIHCAGHCGNLHPLQHTPPEQWLRALQVNLTAPFWLTQNLVPALQAEGGRVIFTEHRQLREPQSYYWHGFGVSQTALATLIDEWEAEAAALNIRVRRVSPPWLDNNFSRAIFPAGKTEWAPVDSVIPLYEEALHD